MCTYRHRALSCVWCALLVCPALPALVCACPGRTLTNTGHTRPDRPTAHTTEVTRRTRPVQKQQNSSFSTLSQCFTTHIFFFTHGTPDRDAHTVNTVVSLRCGLVLVAVFLRGERASPHTSKHIFHDAHAWMARYRQLSMRGQGWEHLLR